MCTTLASYTTNTSTTIGREGGSGSGILKSPGAAFVLTDDFGNKTAYKFTPTNDKSGYSFHEVPFSDIESDVSGWHQKGDSMELNPALQADFQEIMANPAYAAVDATCLCHLYL